MTPQVYLIDSLMRRYDRDQALVLADACREWGMVQAADVLSREWSKTHSVGTHWYELWETLTFLQRLAIRHSYYPTYRTWCAFSWFVVDLNVYSTQSGDLPDEFG
jgi:hypothetical protein